MSAYSKTIYALGSGTGVAGIAVIRLSGSDVLNVAKKICTPHDLKHRMAQPVTLIDPQTKEKIDQALALYFKAPQSFTGDDVLELHIHGSRAVIHRVYRLLSDQGLRVAEPGEFTRRAFDNDKLDLMEVEGLADLIHAETEAQRKQALRQMSGGLSEVYDQWREILVEQLAHLEAAIDFADEELPDDLEKRAAEKIQTLLTQMKEALHNQGGVRIRDGIEVAIVGKPNVGKSSLFNKLLKQDMAIISSTPGTTRDVIEARLDLNGFLINLADTAGIRETLEEIESEGIRRALKKAEAADIVLHVVDDVKDLDTLSASGASFIVLNKADLLSEAMRKKIPASVIPLSTQTGEGIDMLLKKIEETLSSYTMTDPLVTQARHGEALKQCVDALEDALRISQLDLKTEHLRQAARSLGHITGRIDVEELLDKIFSSFCIGK